MPDTPLAFYLAIALSAGLTGFLYWFMKRRRIL